MHVKRLFILTAWLAGWWLIVGLGPASGQQAPPTENKGVKTDALATIDLGPEIDGMQGRQLRLRLITVDPGGVIAMHSHKDRPAVARVLQGTLTEHREGGGGKEYKEGDSWSEGKETAHWAENKGTKPAWSSWGKSSSSRRVSGSKLPKPTVTRKTGGRTRITN